jgi:hypothetical protein
MSVKDPLRQYPVTMTPRVADDLDRLAIDLKYAVPRKGTMRRGPMVGYLCRWFLTLGPEEQIRVIREGKKLLDADLDEGGAAVGNPQPPGPDAMPTTDITDIVVAPKQRKGGARKGKPKPDAQ